MSISLHAVVVAAVFPVVAAMAQAPVPTEKLQPEQPPALRVFLLAGQSNMEGQAVVDLDDVRDYNGGKGTLAAFLAEPKNAKEWPGLRTKNGSWLVRDDVFVSYLPEHGKQKAGPLSVGHAVYEGTHHFGPELGIGRVLGDHFKEPVLLIKTAWGGKSLAQDFRPPSATGDTGSYYTQMLAEYRAGVVAIPKHFPALAKLAPRLEGVLWFQGWNDGCDDKAAAEYEQNLILLVKDLRAEFGDAKLPFVVGETGDMDNQVLRGAQKHGCEDKQIAAGTRFVPTREFLRKPEDSPNTGHGHHWYGNAESYLRIGDALGRAMVELVDARANTGK